MASKTQIFNIALTHLGHSLVSSPSENTGAAPSMLAIYDVVRDAVLRDALWRFAGARASLGVDAAAPAFGWSRQYSMPTDPYCLRVYQVGEDDENPGPEWEVEGRKILTDEGPPLKIRFIRRVTNEGEMPADFVECLALKLAHDCGFRGTESSAKRRELKKLYDDRISAARTNDSTEASRKVAYADTFLEARH